MTHSQDRLIEAAARPFSDNAELRTSAVALLENCVTGSENEYEPAIARWNALDRKKRRPVWKTLLFAGLIIISALMLTDATKVLLQYENMISTMDGSIDFFHNSPKITEEEVAANLTAEETRLLFGDLSKSTAVQRAKARWDSDPENPAYFAAYVNAYLAELSKLPPDFLQTARRIDPENAWFTYVAAGVRAKEAVKHRPQSKEDKAANVPPEWDVLDMAAFNDSLALLKEARSQPKCETYYSKLLRDQMKLLPTNTPAEVVFALAYRFEESPDAEPRLRDLSSVIAAKAWLCGEENDQAAFQDLLVDANGFLRKRADSEVESIIGELINTNIAFGIVTNASPVADKFGLADESARLGEALKIVNLRKALQQSRKPIANFDMIYSHGGQMASLTALYNFRHLQNPPLLTMQDVNPGRLMDHETLAWTGSYFAWAALILGMALAAAFRFRPPALIRRLAVRMECLIRPWDWVLILGLGAVLPTAFFIAITRFTAWGGRERSMEENNIYLPYFDSPPLGLAQFLALAILMIFCSGMTSCVCLWKRTKPFGIVRAGSASALIPTVCIAAFIPISGWSVVHSSIAAAVTAWVLAGISISWLLMIFTRAFLGQYQTQLRYGIVARMLVPALAFAAMLTLSAAPYFKAMAYHWSAEDRLVRTDENYPSGSEFDHRMALQFRKEMREMLGYEK